jgi:triosephosphate isomerase
MAPRKIAAGNWKMNGDLAALAQLDALDVSPTDSCQVLICPPAVLIHAMVQKAEGGAIMVGGQDCHANSSGAHTGDLAAAQLCDVGASHVILGHSERRADHGETDGHVSAKAIAAHQAGLVTVICVGETESQRDSGKTLQVIATQLAGSVPNCATADNSVIAYEPVWAIGTGRTPTDEQIAEVHTMLRDELGKRFADGTNMSLLYGGSVKAANATQIFAIPHVNGALVGGASLKADDFAPIIAALTSA